MIKNFNSKKFFILLIVVCLLFIILVVNAFMYLPKDTVAQDVSNQRAETVNRQLISKAATPQDENETAAQEENQTKKTVKYKLPTDADGMDIVEIDAPPGVDVSKDEKTEIVETKNELSPEENAESYLKKAGDFRASQQYIKALDEYQKVLNLTSDKQITASAYDGIASLYAINKRHGSALTYAIKAYNLYPTTEREMTLARLYYKTGDITKATQRVNNILRREFSDDRW